MSDKNGYIAVFDVGKTNKKMMIYDEQLQLIDSEALQFSEYIENGIRFERIDEISTWFFDKLRKFSQQYAIGSVSVTTHGGTFVCIDENGGIPVPVVAYTTEPDDSFHDEFYSRFGRPDELQEETATAPMGSLVNTGKNIFFLTKMYPEEFKNVQWIINYPQYFGYLLTGNVGAEPTYVGCHSFLWEHRKMDWSRVTRELGILDRVPEKLSHTWDVLGTVSKEAAEKTGLSADTVVTMGVHDSNASLLPYLIKSKEEFVLNSTGTWCVMMHPAKDVSFRPGELGKMIFYNLDVYAHPVKTSILMGGLEFETWSAIMKRSAGQESFPAFDPAVYKKIISEKKLFITPSVQKGTGQFPDSEPRVYDGDRVYHLDEIKNGKIPAFFRDFPTAYAVLNLSLAIQSKLALERTGMVNGMDLFTEGGFRKNPDYNALISAMFQGTQVYQTNLEEATAFGAALLGKAGMEGNKPENYADLFEIETVPVETAAFSGLSEYMEHFFTLL